MKRIPRAERRPSTMGLVRPVVSLKRSGAHRGAVALLVLLVGGAHVGVARGDERPLFSTTLSVELGPDRGQSFGALFEARAADGRVVAGAGFCDVYNTRFRGDRHVVQFFVRPSEEVAPKIEALPHPDLETGVYLLDVAPTISAWSAIRGNQLRTWKPDEKRWADDPPVGAKNLRAGNGPTRVGKGWLTFEGSEAKYDGRTILSPPARGDYHSFYYAHGRLGFYHADREGTPPFTKVVSCAWTPDNAAPIDVARGDALDATVVGSVPFAWGQFRDEALTVSNYGGVYAHGPKGWKTIRAPQLGVSFQVYSMLQFHDRLLMAQYPTGNVFEYDGAKLEQKKDWPPVPEGVAAWSREAQTMCLYGGDLWVGVWPWAEVWRYDRGAGRWHAHGRLFTHPALIKDKAHPYEPEATARGLVANHWGQRVTGMAAQGGSLYLSTSSKGTETWGDHGGFLTEAQRREYGAVHRLDRPGNLAALIDWKPGPTTFQFEAYEKRLVIRQDGRVLGETPFTGGKASDFEKATVTPATGVFGPSSGKIRILK